MNLLLQAGHTETVRLKKKALDNSSLPERWKRNRRRAAAVFLALVVLFSAAFSQSTDYYAERWLSARFTLREMLTPPQPDKRIAIVEMDDKSLAKWPEPLILWGGHLAAAIRQLNRSGAHVIALDWTQPIETDEWLRKDNDVQLGQALSQSRHVVFVKFLKPDGSGYVLPAPSLLFSVPGAVNDNGESSLGLAEAGTSENDTIWQTMQPVSVTTEQGVTKREASFAGRIAVKAGYYKSAKDLPSREMYINFGNRAGKRGQAAPFQWASLYDVATATKPDPRWKGKIVFIGATYKGCNDFPNIPFLAGIGGARIIPGVEVQAHAVRTLLDRNEIRQPKEIKPWLPWLFASFVGALGVLFFTIWNWARASSAIIIVALLWAGLSIWLFTNAQFDLPLVFPVLSLMLGSLLMGGYRALSEERERAQTLKLWGRQQDPRIITELLSNPNLSGGQGREMFVTVLFADLKNFTKTVEMLPPEQAISVLNRYLSLLAEIILQHGGWVDKYLGDGLMAQWGAPLPDEEHAQLALKACLEIENRLRTMTPELRAKGEVSFEVRLTLHSGPVIVGAVGSDERQEFTIIGDTVNVTSRLQETAKELDCNFLISEVTRSLLGETTESQIAFGKAAEVAIRGRQQPLQVYEVVAEQSKLENL